MLENDNLHRLQKNLFDSFLANFIDPMSEGHLFLFLCRLLITITKINLKLFKLRLILKRFLQLQLRLIVIL